MAMNPRNNPRYVSPRERMQRVYSSLWRDVKDDMLPLSALLFLTDSGNRSQVCSLFPEA